MPFVNRTEGTELIFYNRTDMDEPIHLFKWWTPLKHFFWIPGSFGNHSSGAEGGDGETVVQSRDVERSARYAMSWLWGQCPARSYVQPVPYTWHLLRVDPKCPQHTSKATGGDVLINVTGAITSQHVYILHFTLCFSAHDAVQAKYVRYLSITPQ